MRKAIAVMGALALGLAATATATAAQAAEAVGRWRTSSSNGEVEIYRCGPALCGRLVNSDRLKADPGVKDAANKDPALRGRTIKGIVFLQGFTGGPPEWTGGRVYNPEDGNTYQGSITLMPDGKLKLKGCAMAVLCKTQIWTRIAG